jgi:hypothetical protein
VPLPTAVIVAWTWMFLDVDGRVHDGAGRRRERARRIRREPASEMHGEQMAVARQEHRRADPLDDDAVDASAPRVADDGRPLQARADGGVAADGLDCAARRCDEQQAVLLADDDAPQRGGVGARRQNRREPDQQKNTCGGFTPGSWPAPPIRAGA